MTVVVKLNRFRAVTQETEVQLDRIARKAAFDVERYAKHFAPVDTGNLQNSIQVSEKRGEGHYVVVADADYAAAVEYGSDHGSYVLPAQPYMRPAVEHVKPMFLLACQQAVKG